jgi:CheY-like chemotaxis protein
VHLDEEEAIHLANVLCVGINDAMMRKRQSILEEAGHSVTQATDLRRVIAMCESNRFAVAVLGPFLRQPEKLRVTDAVRKHCPGANILELYTSAAPEIPNDADAHLAVDADNFPEELVGAVNRLSTQKPRKQKKGA